MRRALAVAGIAVLALTLALGGAAMAKKKQLTKEQFIAKADKICEETNDAIVDVAEEQGIASKSQPSDDELVDLADEALPIAQKAHDRIEKLREPTADRNEVEEFLDALQVIIDEAKDDPTLVATDTPQVLEAKGLANAYGFEVCGA